MLHTANLVASGGLGTPGLGPSSDEAGNGSKRPTTRKSQIIMEEDDVEDEDIEEVETFSSPEVLETSFREIGNAASDSEPAGQDKKDHVLAPAPDLRPTGVHPPRSSSLSEPVHGIDEAGESKPAESSQTAEAGTGGENEENTAERPVTAEKVEA